MQLNTEINDLDNKIASYQKVSGGAGGEETFKSNIRQLNADYLNTCKERVRLANSSRNLKLRTRNHQLMMSSSGSWQAFTTRLETSISGPISKRKR